MTDAEVKLWQKIRARQVKGHQFFRQRPIGDYIVDFYCPTTKLVIEVDGGQHYTESGKARDEIRDDCLRSYSLKVVRFSDTDVLNNIDGVLEQLFDVLP